MATHDGFAITGNQSTFSGRWLGMAKDSSGRIVFGDPRGYDTEDDLIAELICLIDSAMECEFVGCKCKATTIAHKLWGKGGTLRTCDAHKPGSAGTHPIAQARPFYRLEPIAN